MYFNKSLVMDGGLASAWGEDGIGGMVELIVSDEKEQLSDDHTQGRIPLLALRNMVLFPNVVVPISVKERQAMHLIEVIHEKDGLLGIIAQRNPENFEGKQTDVYPIGTLAKIIKIINLPNGKTIALVHGKQKFQTIQLFTESLGLEATIQLLKDHPYKEDKKVLALMQSLKDVAIKILKFRPDGSGEAQAMLTNIKSLDFLTYFLASNLNTDIHYKQKLLELSNSTKRANLLLKHLLRELEISELKKEIQDKVHSDISQQQRDYYLRQQVKVLQDELGENEGSDEIDRLREKGNKKQWPKEVANYFKKALEKAERMSPHSPDYSISINHAELLVELPWEHYTKDNLDLTRAKKIFDADHYGIEKVKERLLEFLAVVRLKKNMKGPILCLCGPPGVGKTSLGKSIAKAMGRKYARIALGGLNDEAEIRGHRKTYIGAMAGKIIYNIQKSGSSNPVIVLDEVDKIDGMRGDPASALLEVLDPEQNNAFVDHFLEVPYDLSKILFVATANSMDRIPSALQDRMEVIEVSGYLLEEKIEIAKKYLFPKQRKEHGLKATDLAIQDDALATIIASYTRESGVRELSRQIANICRKSAKSIALAETYTKKIKPTDVIALLGPEPFDQTPYQTTSLPGVSIGLAWTAAGGEILFIESVLSKGKGRINLSGHLGEVMKESAMTALSYLKANDQYLDVSHGVFENYDLHIHVPSGAVPKDGPSAGITLFTSLASLYTQKKVKDCLAMTGEITLRGEVLPVGGIKEKILAAKRVGMKEIILSSKNKKDVQEIKAIYRESLIFHYVDSVDQVYRLALQENKIANPKVWDGSLAEPITEKK
ncbi:Lon protease [Cardinium endosymbiont cEper1 of Encarsia pergandiella]|uniref:endopeptidase La n=1 Tax=Cardinium endosymbiont of Encarsia pergandiella TaxID=249402 RepID=UPI00027EAAF6|nr:endopeptidase La [Cardinium endosymbiont of Encarsia pergandiella]CCM10502.1 Lon protease [Cardinium endosymbiont cEper1 of Encarsia pergandiella]